MSGAHRQELDPLDNYIQYIHYIQNTALGMHVDLKDGWKVKLTNGCGTSSQLEDSNKILDEVVAADS